MNFITAKNIIRGCLDDYVPNDLFFLSKIGEGYGEYSIASLILQSSDISELEKIITSNSSSDIVYNGYRFEVKYVKNFSRCVRANNNSKLALFKISSILLRIYNFLYAIFMKADIHSVNYFNQKLREKYELSVTVPQLIEHAIEKIQKSTFTRIFLGLDKPKSLKKIDLQSFVELLESCCSKGSQCNIIERVASVAHNEYNFELVKSELYLAFIKAYKGELNLDSISALLLELKLSKEVERLHDYLINHAVYDILGENHGIFFVIGDTREFIYIPNRLFQKYIEIAGSSQSISIRLKVSELN